MKCTRGHRHWAFAVTLLLSACDMDSNNTDWTSPQPIDEREVVLGDDEPLWHKRTLSVEDIEQLENELLIEVPEFLRSWMGSNPLSEIPDGSRALAFHRDFLIKKNVEVRRGGYYGRDWPENLLWLGDDWGAGAYYVDTRAAGPAIYYYDWEDGEGDVVTPSVSEKFAPENFVSMIGDL